MIINLTKAKLQVRELEICVSNLYESKREISSYRVVLNNNWMADEVRYFNKSIEKLLSDIDKAISILNDLKGDVQREIAKTK